jgi:molybdenum ABC transporter molybdate-binding protein
MRRFGPGLAFLVSLALLAGLIFLLVWNPKKKSDKGVIVVYCAAGLRSPVEEIAREYEKNEGVEVSLNYGGSETLLANLEVSKKGDLYIPADTTYIDQARSKGLVDEVLPVAAMTPVIAVHANNPKHIKSLDDLLASGITLSQADPDAAAIGSVTRQALKKCNKWDAIQQKVKVNKATVTDVANDVSVAKGIDAGFVWDVTIVQFKGKLLGVPVREFEGVTGKVSAAILKSSKQPAAAVRFARFLTARDRGLEIFQKHGFQIIPDGDLWAGGEPKINIYAGAMLRPAIAETLKKFAQREGIPEENIRCVFNGCGILVAQMNEKTGQHPDAFFACDARFMREVKDLFLDDRAISSNQLVILVHKGNPKNIRSMRDLAQKGLRIAIGNEQQCAMGVLTQETLKQTGTRDPVMKNVVDQTPTGDMLVNKMLAAPSSLDAVIAYVSNGVGAGDRLEAISINVPCALAVQPVAVGKESKHRYLMQRLVDALRSAESRSEFEANGFKWLDSTR